MPVTRFTPGSRAVILNPPIVVQPENDGESNPEIDADVVSHPAARPTFTGIPFASVSVVLTASQSIAAVVSPGTLASSCSNSVNGLCGPGGTTISSGSPCLSCSSRMDIGGYQLGCRIFSMMRVSPSGVLQSILPMLTGYVITTRLWCFFGTTQLQTLKPGTGSCRPVLAESESLLKRSRGFRR